jgi:DNA-binding response OmpR family regulator
MLDVLVADDDAVARSLLAAAARRMGHRVFEANDGNLAWEMYQALTPALVISDWRMPELDGLELCRRIKKREGDRVFVLLVTGRGQHEDLEEALAAGVDDYLTKPVQPGHFKARMTIAKQRLAVSAARRHAEEELARVRWLLGINQTVRTFQHEINNPLAALYGCLELLVDQVSNDSEAAVMARTAIVQAERITEVVRRLSDYRGGPTVEAIPGVSMLDLSLVPDQTILTARAAALAPTSSLTLLR